MSKRERKPSAKPGTQAGSSARLKQIIAEHGSAEIERAPEGWMGVDPLLAEVLYSIVLWESSTERARTAFCGLPRHVTDVNELRICQPDEIAGMLAGIALAAEKGERLRATLMSVMHQERALSLSRVAGLSRREARSYLEGLSGLPPFAAQRATLLVLGEHVMPVEERTRALLVAEGVITSRPDLEQTAHWIERQLTGGEYLHAFGALRRWADQQEEARKKSVGGRASAKPAKKNRSRPGA